MNSALTRYRVMATVVGVLLIVLCLVGVPLANFDGSGMWGVFPGTPNVFPVGSTAHDVGELITTYLGVAHGWLYMLFLITAFQLSRRERWDLPFTLVTLVCGTIPILSFWAEHRATARVRARSAIPAPASRRRVSRTPTQVRSSSQAGGSPSSRALLRSCAPVAACATAWDCSVPRSWPRSPTSTRATSPPTSPAARSTATCCCG